MANCRLLLSAIPYTPTADSVNADFPVANIQVYANLLQKYQAAVSTGIVNVMLDFGSGQTFSSLATDPGLLIDDVNVTSARIQGNTVTTNWVTPPWDQAVTIVQDGITRRYKTFLRLADLSAAAFAYRYLNIRIVSQDPTDGTPYRIGRVWPGSVTELLMNPLYDSERSYTDPMLVTELIGGGQEYNDMGPRRFEAKYKRRMVGASQITQELLVQALPTGTAFVLWDASFGGSQSAWLVRQITAPTYTERYLSQHEGIVWTVREVI